MAIKVLEVDQWTSTGDVRKYNFETFKLENIVGGNAAEARAIFGGHALVREVEEHQQPPKGHVWYREVDGYFERYKFNYDSSD